ncbi:hypothetical protein JN11_04257 [Mucilaginibacter frigoritolerans]|uniref:Uncharacterized protein n=1 Tax=Mucilaginibacter frigoritolerans TaxID=652788 RepID=A0A562TR14_9SPHI|nr:hypothetical protein JN11_04257 [Mucilaginibacter frigoritolerans]
MKKIIVYYLLFLLGYILLIVFTSPFLMTWGQKRGIFESLYVWFLTKPFNLNYSPWFILFNYICWATFFYLLVIAIKKLIRKLK